MWKSYNAAWTFNASAITALAAIMRRPEFLSTSANSFFKSFTYGCHLDWLTDNAAYQKA
jgi:hypothetical protein